PDRSSTRSRSGAIVRFATSGRTARRAPASRTTGSRRSRPPGRRARRRARGAPRRRTRRAPGLLAPLDAAPGGRRLGNRRVAPIEPRVQSVRGGLLGHGRLVPAVVDRAVVAEPPLAVEEENLRCSFGTEGARERLVLV